MWHFAALSSIGAEEEWDHNASCPGGGDTGMRSSRSTGKRYTPRYGEETCKDVNPTSVNKSSSRMPLLNRKKRDNNNINY